MKKVFSIYIVAVMALFSAFAGGSSEKSKITVMLPPWAEPPSNLVQEFTQETGIEVEITIVGFDDIRNKIAIAAVGNETPADVLEVDWSWVGEFYNAGWLEPLEVSESDKKDIPTLSSFTTHGEVLAIPYSNDFRIGFYNKAHFSQVGYNSPPQSWEEVFDAAEKIKKAGIAKYPLSYILSSSEATSTSFYWLVLSLYGELFDDEYNLNNANALSGLKLIQDLIVNKEIINPASQNMTDNEIYPQILSGESSFIIAPTFYLSFTKDTEQSKTVGDVFPVLIPKGKSSGRSVTIALPEAIGVSKFSKNKEAAKKFVEWFVSLKNQELFYDSLGLLPTRVSGLDSLTASGKVNKEDGQVLSEQATFTTSPFPTGTPSWYPDLSTVIFNNINKLAASAQSPEETVKIISDKIQELKEKNK